MAVRKITFDGASVTSLDDAILNSLNCPYDVCTLNKYLGMIGVRIVNNYIIFPEVYVIVKGRLFYIEKDTQVYVSMDSTKKGVVVLDVNLQSGTAELTKVEGTTDPTLIQEDINDGGTRYQAPLFKYSKTTSSITNLSYYPPSYYGVSGFVEDKIYEYDEEHCYDHGFHKVLVPSHQRTNTLTYQLYDEAIPKWNKGTVYILTSAGVLITFPSHMYSDSSSSAKTVKYSVAGVDYICTLEVIGMIHYGGSFKVTLSNTNHKIIHLTYIF